LLKARRFAERAAGIGIYHYSFSAIYKRAAACPFNWRRYFIQKDSTMTQTQLDKVIYTAKVHTPGGRDGGASQSNDGRLNIHHSVPGAPGTGTNPEHHSIRLANH
jgi:hypothetical protein